VQVILRRLANALTKQDWFTVLLEILIVVVGIFIGLQVDDWNEDRKLQAVVVGNLSGLAYDFATNRDLLEDVRDRHRQSTRAIEDILMLGSDPGNELSHDEFYKKMRWASATRKFTVVSRTYDSLISAGLVEVIPSEDLKTAIADFYTLVERIKNAQEDMQAIQSFVLDPFISKHLDHAALMVFTHPEAVRIRPSRPVDQFRDIVGTDEFEGVLVTKWHVSQDLTNLFSLALEQIDTIDDLIRQIVGRDEIPGK
jgi:hypothetical protein